MTIAMGSSVTTAQWAQALTRSAQKLRTAIKALRTAERALARHQNKHPQANQYALPIVRDALMELTKEE